MNKLKIWPIAYCENEGLISEDLLPAFTEVRVIRSVRGPSRWRTGFASGFKGNDRGLGTLVAGDGIEPSTSRFSVARSYQLSYPAVI